VGRKSRPGSMPGLGIHNLLTVLELSSPTAEECQLHLGGPSPASVTESKILHLGLLSAIPRGYKSSKQRFVWRRQSPLRRFARVDYRIGDNLRSHMACDTVRRVTAALALVSRLTGVYRVSDHCPWPGV